MIKTVKDVDLKGKRIIMRVDFNVPMKEGVVQDDTRIMAALPTIKYILEQSPRSLVLMSHLGDPKKDVKKAQEKAEKAAKKKGAFQNMKAEFKRIVWPDKNTVVKESTAVIVVTIILAVVIAFLDFVIKTGLDKILQIG